MSLVMLVFPIAIRHRIVGSWPAVQSHLARLICGVRWQLHGENALPKGSVVLAPKHQSTWETYYLMGLFPKPLCFVYKKELHFIPFFGWGIATLKMIAIDRGKARDAFEQVVAQGQANIALGRSLIMFPEGTRIPVGQKGNYKSGAARFAIRTNTPVVPVAVTAGKFWPRKSLILRPGLVHVSYGPALYPEGHTPESLTKKIEEWIEAEMRRLAPEDYR
jgi:1-acyl-sn-glycerol-3-phosphate acyltransferase